jgi:hypothetical protein
MPPLHDWFDADAQVFTERLLVRLAQDGIGQRASDEPMDEEESPYEYVVERGKHSGDPRVSFAIAWIVCSTCAGNWRSGSVSGPLSAALPAPCGSAWLKTGLGEIGQSESPKGPQSIRSSDTSAQIRSIPVDLNYSALPRLRHHLARGNGRAGSF